MYVRHHHIHHRSGGLGFSLIEVSLMLMILTIVAVPMLMAINLQNVNVQEAKRLSSEQNSTQQLFDNVDSHHPNPINAYTVSTKTSIYCDPATRTKTPADYTAQCQANNGSDRIKNPYFTRQVAFTDEYQNLEVQVLLYETQASTTPYYSETRTYPINSYRVNGGYSLTTSSSLDDFNNQIKIDPNGNGWYPSLVLPSAAASNSNYAYYSYQGCPVQYFTNVQPPPSPYRPALKVPFDSYTFSNSSQCGMFEYNTYVFKASPETRYTIKAYFTTPNISSMNCNSVFTHNLSCEQVNIFVKSTDGTNETQYDNLYIFGGYDIGNATSNENYRGNILNLGTLTTPPNTKELIIQIHLPPSSTGPDREFYSLAGLEVIRREKS